MDTQVPDLAVKNALMDADYAALSARPCTDQAQRLVDEVFSQVVVGGSKGRGGGYSDTKQQMFMAVMGFLGDLLWAAGNGWGWVYRSLQKKSFTGQEVGYHAFKRVLERLKELGFVEHKPGYRQLIDGFDPAGPKFATQSRTSRFRATPKLLALADDFGVPTGEAKRHFLQQLPKHPLVLKATSTRDRGGQKQQGKNLKFERTEKTDKLEADVLELNEFLDRFKLQGGMHRGYIRVFNCGDDPDFGWNRGGRLYSRGGEEDNYQRLSQEKRLQMTIDGEPVVEIDIKASYLTIFLSWHHQEVQGDPYAIPGLPRDIAKKFFVIAFGNDGQTKRWSREQVREYRREIGRQLGRDYPINMVRDTVRGTYPVVERIAEHRNIWAKLMWIESMAMITTMQRLMREHGVPSLSIHDSLIVPESKLNVAQELLGEQYYCVSQIQPQLVVKLPPTLPLG